MKENREPEYALDAYGVIHVVDPYGGEHTICGWSFDNTEDGRKLMREPVHGNMVCWVKTSERPITCPQCIDIVLTLRNVQIGRRSTRQY